MVVASSAPLVQCGFACAVASTAESAALVGGGASRGLLGGGAARRAGAAGAAVLGEGLHEYYGVAAFVQAEQSCASRG